MTSQSSFSYTISDEYFGDFHRFRLQTFRTRFATVTYFVHDAERLDEYDMPKVVAQSDSRDEAIKMALSSV